MSKPTHDLAKRLAHAPAASGEQTATLITSVKDRPGHDWRYAIDATRIKGELGFSPQHDFTAGLHGRNV